MLFEDDLAADRSKSTCTNASRHSPIKRFHVPGSEMRSVAIIKPADYDDWLAARSMDETRSLVTLLDGKCVRLSASPNRSDSSNACFCHLRVRMSTTLLGEV